MAEVYKVTFIGTWNVNDLDSGESMPNNAHFTELVGSTHTSNTNFWQPGSMATPGHELVAEEGINTTIEIEIATAITAGDAGVLVKTDNYIATLPGQVSTVFEATAPHSYVSAISMIAPSPDWFVGVYNVALQNAGVWLDNVDAALTPWDAGTEEGTRFRLNWPPTVPQQPIGLPPADPFLGSPVIASLHFVRIAPTGDVNENGALDVGDLVLATRYVLGLETPTLQQRARADIMPLGIGNNPEPDGVVTLIDVMKMQQLLLSP